MMAAAALTTSEQADLRRLEGIVQRGMQTFCEVGKALAEIQERRLYRLTHKTFTAYCEERWGMSKSHAYRHIEVSKTIETLSPMGDKNALPANERQARELAPLTPEARYHAMQAASRDTTPTASKLHEIAAKALAGLTPAEQIEIIKAEEAKVIREAPAYQYGGERKKDKVAQVIHLVDRLRRMMEFFVGTDDDACAAALEHLDRFASAVEAMAD